MSEHTIAVEQHGPSVNAPAGHWHWGCAECGVGSVGWTEQDLQPRIAEHVAGLDRMPTPTGALW